VGTTARLRAEVVGLLIVVAAGMYTVLDCVGVINIKAATVPMKQEAVAAIT
jgi:hypothetical protein